MAVAGAGTDAVAVAVAVAIPSMTHAGNNGSSNAFHDSCLRLSAATGTATGQPQPQPHTLAAGDSLRVTSARVVCVLEYCRIQGCSRHWATVSRWEGSWTSRDCGCTVALGQLGLLVLE